MKKILTLIFSALISVFVQGKVAQENQSAAQKSVENWLDGLGMKK